MAMSEFLANKRTDSYQVKTSDTPGGLLSYFYNFPVLREIFPVHQREVMMNTYPSDVLLAHAAVSSCLTLFEGPGSIAVNIQHV
jgi:hypothetical protein